MANLSYEDFTKFIFDRPIYSSGKQWFFQNDYEDPTFDFSSPFCEKSLVMSCICLVFQNIEKLYRTYSVEQFFFGLQYIIDWSCGGSFRHYFFSAEVPDVIRIQAVSLMFVLYEKVFVKVCSNVSEPDDLSEISINRLCFMWWDMFSTTGMPINPDTKKISRAILDNLDKILSLDNVICKKSALHGLGHLYSDYPEEVQEIITRHENEIPDCLSNYASHACVFQ